MDDERGCVHGLVPGACDLCAARSEADRLRREVFDLRRDNEDMRNSYHALWDRIVRNAKGAGIPRWLAVKRATGHGSTVAKQKCEEHGKDPDELLNTPSEEEGGLAAVRDALKKAHDRIAGDERFHYPPAKIAVNAPLALEQNAMAAQMQLIQEIAREMGWEFTP